MFRNLDFCILTIYFSLRRNATSTRLMWLLVPSYFLSTSGHHKAFSLQGDFHVFRKLLLLQRIFVFLNQFSASLQLITPLYSPKNKHSWSSWIPPDCLNEGVEICTMQHQQTSLSGVKRGRRHRGRDSPAQLQAAAVAERHPVGSQSWLLYSAVSILSM